MAYQRSQEQPRKDPEPEKIDAGPAEEAVNIGDLMALKESTEKILHEKEEVIHTQELINQSHINELPQDSIVDEAIVSAPHSESERYRKMICEMFKALNTNPRTQMVWRNIFSRDLVRDVEAVAKGR